MLREKDCDVLVIGGGLAGMRAALESAGLGRSVIITAEGQVGKSGNSVIAQGGYSAPFGQIDPRDDVEAFYEDVLASGRGLCDPPLVRTFAEQSCAAVDELRSVGVKFAMNGPDYAQKHYPGHSYPRNCYLEKEGGFRVTRPLLEQISKSNIQILNHCHAVRLIILDGQCCGALFVSARSDDLYVIRAKATVLATGGAAGIYQYSTNVSSAIGGGFALALQSGARLRDMEFVQFYPTIMLSPIRNFLIDFAPLARHVHLINRYGERFVEKYGQKSPESSTRDVRARAVFLEIVAGRDVEGGVLLDMSKLDWSDIKEHMPRLAKALEIRGINPFDTELVVAPAAHFCMGGVEIDQNCRTSISGLFACGEVTGGLHGANRLADNALTECQVFGRIAGEEAAGHSSTCDIFSLPVEAIVDELIDAESVMPTAPDSMRKIRRIMWENVGIVRDATGLRKGIAELEDLARQACQKGPVISFSETYRRYRLKSAVITALAIAEASLLREESRGAHFREDFPIEAKGYAKPIVVEKDPSGCPKAFFPGD